jgi:UDP-2,4-diacetamido-2,4,6-trideoxy-beta-L-altropyranose hydrolase
MNDPPALAVRADGGPGIGVGHVARCLALCQAWLDRGGRALLVTAGAGGWEERYHEEGVDVVAVDADVGEVDWWAVDGYELGDGAVPGPRILSIDDHGRAGRTRADVVVDQNLGVTSEPYPTGYRLLGPRYALLRREIASATPGEQDEAERRVVVVAGGAPTSAVRRFVDAVVGTLDGVRVDRLTGTDDVAAALAGAPVALAAAGSVTWELCRMGVPAVLFAAADNQRPVAAAAAGAGAAVDVTDASPEAVAAVVVDLLADHDRRRAMAAAGTALVDGGGAARVVTRLRSSLVDLRPATMDDADLLLAWANDAATRAASFSSAPIERSDHVAWLARRLRSADAFQLVADVGVVRFDVEGADAEISVAVAPERRGGSWAGPLIDAGCRWLGAARPDVARVVARIKATNVASQRAFAAADFDLEPLPGAEGEVRYARPPDGRS